MTPKFTEKRLTILPTHPIPIVPTCLKTIYIRFGFHTSFSSNSSAITWFLNKKEIRQAWGLGVYALATRTPTNAVSRFRNAWGIRVMGLRIQARHDKLLVHFSICACHPCAGAMLIFPVSEACWGLGFRRSRSDNPGEACGSYCIWVALCWQHCQSQVSE